MARVEEQFYIRQGHLVQVGLTTSQWQSQWSGATFVKTRSNAKTNRNSSSLFSFCSYTPSPSSSIPSSFPDPPPGTIHHPSSPSPR